jgi:hypothetical protein
MRPIKRGFEINGIAVDTMNKLIHGRLLIIKSYIERNVLRISHQKDFLHFPEYL